MKTITFTSTSEPFSAMHQAEAWAKDNGFSIGALQRNQPVALKKGEQHIPKWSNLTIYDQASADAVLRWPNGDSRTGDAVLEIRIAFPDAATQTA